MKLENNPYKIFLMEGEDLLISTDLTKVGDLQDEINKISDNIGKEKFNNLRKAKDSALQKLQNTSPFNRPQLTDEEITALKKYYSLLTKNKKTALSIDFLPGIDGTCYMSCKYCYALQALKVHSKFKIKLVAVTNLIKYYPDIYYQIIKDQLREMLKFTTEKFQQAGGEGQIDFIRWFGFGDFQPYMTDVIIQIAKDNPDIKFSIISKTLALPQNKTYLEKILKECPNIQINLSFHHSTPNLYEIIDDYIKLKNLYPNLSLAYTLDKFEGIRIYKVVKDENGNIVISSTGEPVKGEEITIEYISKILQRKEKEKKEIKPTKGKTTTPKEIEKKEKEPKEIKIGKKTLEKLDIFKMPNIIVEIEPKFLTFLQNFDIIFNVNKQQAFRFYYYKFAREKNLNFCECDLKIIYETYACAVCRRCFTSRARIQTSVSEKFGDEYLNIDFTNSNDVYISPIHGKKLSFIIENLFLKEENISSIKLLIFFYKK